MFDVDSVARTNATAGLLLGAVTEVMRRTGVDRATAVREVDAQVEEEVSPATWATVEVVLDLAQRTCAEIEAQRASLLDRKD